MAYSLWITESEMSAIRWVGCRYETSELLLKYLSPASEEPNDKGEIEYKLEEWQAWSLNEAAENQDGGPWLPCIEGALQDKWMAFLNSIV